MMDQIHSHGEGNGDRSLDGVSLMIEDAPSNGISIKVIGIGGCGGNAVGDMIDTGMNGIEFVCLNTDEQALLQCKSQVKMLIGQRVTHSHGTGSDPQVGREAALDNTDELTDVLTGSDMVFLVVGLGGGTGTGGAPVLASLAKQMGALTVAIAVTPYTFEGRRRNAIADEGFGVLLDQVDTAIRVSNEEMLEQIESGTGFFDSFRVANRYATGIVQGITELLNKRGVINSDFADLRGILEDAGEAVVGSGRADGADAAVQAAREAVNSLTVDASKLARSTKVLINIAGSSQFSMRDAGDALAHLHSCFSENAQFLLGAVLDESLGSSVSVLLIASGFKQVQRSVEEEEFEAEPEHVELTESDGTDSEPFGPEMDPFSTPAERVQHPFFDPEPEGPPVAATAAHSPEGHGERDGNAGPDEEVSVEFVPLPNIRASNGDREAELETKGPIFRRGRFFR